MPMKAAWLSWGPTCVYLSCTLWTSRSSTDRSVCCVQYKPPLKPSSLMTLRNHRLVNTCHLLFFFYSNLAYPTDHRVQICILHTRYFPPYTSGAGTHSSNYLSRRLGIYLSNCLRGLLTNVSIVQNSPISTEWYFLTYSRCNFDTASLLVHRPLPLNDASNVNLVMIVVLIDLCD